MWGVEYRCDQCEWLLSREDRRNGVCPQCKWFKEHTEEMEKRLQSYKDEIEELKLRLKAEGEYEGR